MFASIAALVYFIRKSFSKYKTKTELNIDGQSGKGLVKGASVVTNPGGSDAVVYAADGSLIVADDEIDKGQKLVGNPVAVSATVVVVDMENDNHEKWTNHEYSPQPSRRRRPEETQ